MGWKTLSIVTGLSLLLFNIILALAMRGSVDPEKDFNIIVFILLYFFAGFLGTWGFAFMFKDLGIKSNSWIGWGLGALSSVVLLVIASGFGLIHGVNNSWGQTNNVVLSNEASFNLFLWLFAVSPCLWFVLVPVLVSVRNFLKPIFDERKAQALSLKTSNLTETAQNLEKGERIEEASIAYLKAAIWARKTYQNSPHYHNLTIAYLAKAIELHERQIVLSALKCRQIRIEEFAALFEKEKMRELIPLEKIKELESLVLEANTKGESESLANRFLRSKPEGQRFLHLISEGGQVKMHKLAEEFELNDDTVRLLVETAIKTKAVHGLITKDGKTFIKFTELRKKIEQWLDS